MPYHESEEHTSELQSLTNLVCRLLLEKKRKKKSKKKCNTAVSETKAREAVTCFEGKRTKKPELYTYSSLHSFPFLFFFFFKRKGPPEIIPLSPNGPLPA